MKRSSGECFMCKTVQEVRYFDLYVIGSEDCHLCLPCELQVVEMVRQAAGQALQKRKQEFLAKRDKTKCPTNGQIHTNPENHCSACREGNDKPKNAFTGRVSGW